jgi:protease I
MMNVKRLENKKIAVLVETEYIPKEINCYKNEFVNLGAEVHFMAHLWGREKITIVSDVTTPGEMPESMEVTMEVADANPNDYDAVIMAANYCAVRLREIPPMGSLGSLKQVTEAPTVKFYAGAMKNKRIIKAAMCHALWILTPHPELLKNRKVICHTVVLADIINAGAIFVPDPKELVIDEDLITARSAANLDAYRDAIIQALCNQTPANRLQPSFA